MIYVLNINKTPVRNDWGFFIKLIEKRAHQPSLTGQKKLRNMPTFQGDDGPVKPQRGVSNTSGGTKE